MLHTFHVQAGTVTYINTTTASLSDVFFPSVTICNVNQVGSKQPQHGQDEGEFFINNIGEAVNFGESWTKYNEKTKTFRLPAEVLHRRYKQRKPASQYEQNYGTSERKSQLGS